MARFELTENGVDITVEVHVTVAPEIVSRVAALLEGNDFPLRYTHPEMDAAEQLAAVCENAIEDEYPPYAIWWSPTEGLGYFHVDDDHVANDEGFTERFDIIIY